MPDSIAAEPVGMDASPATPTLAGGWDMNSTRPPSAPHFVSAFDVKPTCVEAPRAHLNHGLGPSSALASNIGDYLGGHRLIVGSNFGPPSMIGLRPSDPNYFIKDFVPRSEDFLGLYEQHRLSGRREEDLGAAESPAGASLATPVTAGGGLNGTNEDGDANIACLSQYSGRLLPTLTTEKGADAAGNEVANHEEEGDNGDGGGDDGDYDDDNDDDDDDGTAWPCQTMPTTTSAAMHEKSAIVLRQGSAARGTSPIACQDCGNQAKKDCVHTRCRTCCKSRGLACATHVKSTWVPAFKRRQRHQLFSNDGEQPMKPLHTSKPTRSGRPNMERAGASDAAAANNSYTSTSTGTPPPSSDLNWLQQEGSLKRVLPAEAREHAVFKCVRLTGVNDGQEEYAYQTVVKIGGHIYKGMLYDQGLDRGQASSSSIAELRLGGKTVAPSSSATIDLAGHLYGTSESVFLGVNHATH